jgi:gliding motility-associated-like protein
MGDYTYAGHPFEGWEIQTSIGRGQAFQNPTGTYSVTPGFSLTGNIVSYSNTCGGATATWAGNANGTLDIKMETMVDTNASWVTMNVRLRNMTGTALPGIYYLRSCDPDADQTWTGGGFPTNNRVIYQNDLIHRVLVKAQAITRPYCYMGLGTIDARAVAFIYNMWPMASTVDLAACWNQTYTPAFYNVGVNYPGDIAIGLVFNIGTIAAGDSASFSYYYIFGDSTNLDSARGPLSASNNGPICIGDTLKLSSITSTGGCSYTWRWYGPGGFTSTVQNPVIPHTTAGSAGTYYVVRASFGVTDTASTIVVLYPGAAPITGINAICEGATTLLSDATPRGNWISSNPGIATITSGGSVTGVSAGTCTITYLLAGGCFVTLPFNVYAIPSPMTGGVVCVTDSLAMTNLVPGGIWLSGAPTIATVSAGGVVTGISGGNALITYVIGGTCYATATVTVNPQPDAGILNGPSTICLGDIIYLTPTVPGGTWNTIDSNITLLGGSVTGVATGTAIISYSVSNSCGTATTTKTVTVMPMPIVSGKQDMCVGDTVMLHGNLTGATWQSANDRIAMVSDSGTVKGISAAITIISYYIDTGCIATITVTVNPLPDPGNITGKAKLCPGGTVTLLETISGGIWEASDTSVISISLGGTITANGIGSATILYTVGPDSNGCINKDTFTVTVAPSSLAMTSTVNDVRCYGEDNGSISLQVSGGIPPYEYKWSTGATTSSIDSLVPGTYSVVTKEPATNCIRTDSFTITEPDSLQLALEVHTDICRSKKGSIIPDVKGGYQPYKYLWSNNSTSNELTDIIADSYTLTITDKNGCKVSISAEVPDSCADIIVRNGVTPNGDGVNDTWIIENLAQYPTNTVQVFDKWGDLMFEQGNYQNDWYGMRKNNTLVPDGTYYYLVKLNTKNVTGGKEVFTGALLIKR